MSTLTLALRTPTGLLCEREVRAVVAEDLSGWFGILPGRADLVAALPPGLLVFRHDEGEGFVALAGGLLNLARGRCTVMAREAVLTDRLEALTEVLSLHVERRRRRSEAQRDVLDRLAREALRRVAGGAPR